MGCRYRRLRCRRSHRLVAIQCRLGLGIRRVWYKSRRPINCNCALKQPSKLYCVEVLPIKVTNSSTDLNGGLNLDV